MIDVLFMGTPEYAKQILAGLLDDTNIRVVGVFTQPDKPVGRKKLLTPPPVKTLALQHNLELFQPQKLRDEESVAAVLAIKCDYIVVAAYGQILPLAILEHAPCINLHASILPAFRGASPIQQTLLQGDALTGVTAMLMEEGLDTGDILAIETLVVEKDTMVEKLFEDLTELARDLTLEVLHNFSSFTPQKQQEKEASYCKKITKADGEVHFENARELYNKYRAFTPWPGVYLSSGLKLKKIMLHDEKSYENAGEILSIEKDSIIVSCKKGALRIYCVQPVSKNEMDVLSYINGKRLSLADTLV